MNKRNVKHYLRVCTLARDGLLVVKKAEPFMPTHECIVITQGVFPGLVNALHLQFDHPSPHQLKQIVKRSFYAISMDDVIDDICHNCSTCASLKSFPKHLTEQSSKVLPSLVGITYAADVLKRERQLILIVREHVTSFIQATIIPNEQQDTL